MMTSDVVGLVAVSQSGGRGLVLSAQDDRLTLRCTDGIKRVPRSSVVRFEGLSSPVKSKFTTWDVELKDGIKGKVLIPGLFHSFVELEDGSKDWLPNP